MTTRRSPPNPHGFAAIAATIAPRYPLLSATFLATDGTVVIPLPVRYFEFPIVGQLPEDLNFIR